METKEYLTVARAAGEVGAHVAAVMAYRTAADAACAWDVGAVVREAMEYATRLAKPVDKLSVYAWSQQVIEQRGLGGELETLVAGYIAEVNKDVSL